MTSPEKLATPDSVMERLSEIEHSLLILREHQTLHFGDAHNTTMEATNAHLSVIALRAEVSRLDAGSAELTTPITNLLDAIHAGRFVPLDNSRGYCASVVADAENALAALPAPPAPPAPLPADRKGVLELAGKVVVSTDPMFGTQCIQWNEHAPAIEVGDLVYIKKEKS